MTAQNTSTVGAISSRPEHGEYWRSRTVWRVGTWDLHGLAGGGADAPRRLGRGVRPS